MKLIFTLGDEGGLFHECEGGASIAEGTARALQLGRDYPAKVFVACDLDRADEGFSGIEYDVVVELDLAYREGERDAMQARMATLHTLAVASAAAIRIRGRRRHVLPIRCPIALPHLQLGDLERIAKEDDDGR